MNLNEYLSNFCTKNISIIGPMQHDQLTHLEPLIYVDGGVNWKESTKGFSIGDEDSSNHPLDQTLPKEKDFSDFAFALSHCNKFRELNLYGFLGGRRDHELINFGEVQNFLKSKQGVKVSFESKIFALSTGTYKLKHKGCFSTFCFAQTKLSILGDVKYKLQNDKLEPHCSHGLSNEADGLIEITTTKPVFIFLN